MSIETPTRGGIPAHLLLGSDIPSPTTAVSGSSLPDTAGFLEDIRVIERIERLMAQADQRKARVSK